jgi:glycosyltransferase involved in cell wall biosynthesis
LPVIEALACGSAVVASEIPVLQEVGGTAVSYCPLTQIEQWVATIKDFLQHPAGFPTVEQRLQQAARYSWSAHAQTIAQVYAQL